MIPDSHPLTKEWLSLPPLTDEPHGLERQFGHLKHVKSPSASCILWVCTERFSAISSQPMSPVCYRRHLCVLSLSLSSHIGNNVTVCLCRGSGASSTFPFVLCGHHSRSAVSQCLATLEKHLFIQVSCVSICDSNFFFFCQHFWGKDVVLAGNSWVSWASETAVAEYI